MNSDSTLDCVGLYCPLPIYQAANKMKEMAKGQVLELLADDEGIKPDMAAWCEVTGNELLEIEEDGGQYKVYVKKTG